MSIHVNSSDLSLADRQKYYEKLGSSGHLLHTIPILVRIDGISFHTLLSTMDRPFDRKFIEIMKEVALKLTTHTNASLGYVQSDEISLVFKSNSFRSGVYFNAKKDKIVSSLASLAAYWFYKKKEEIGLECIRGIPIFDCRTWNLPCATEAANYFIWRETDAIRNSIQMYGHKYFSTNQLYKKTCDQIKEMLIKEHNVDWNDLDPHIQRGYYIQRRVVNRKYTVDEIDKLPSNHDTRTNPSLTLDRREFRISHESFEMPYLTKLINREQFILEGADPII